MELTKKVQRRLAIGAGLVTVAGISAAVLISLAMPGKPTLYLEGAEMRRAPDGSVQLLATLSIENVPGSGGLGGINLKSNNTYLRPSDYATNAVLEDSFNGDAVYHVPDDLCEGEDPYQKLGDLGTGTMVMADEENGYTYIYGSWLTKTTTENTVKGKLHPMENKTESDKDPYQLYIDAEDKTALVQLSYRVDTDHLADMVSAFGGRSREGNVWDRDIASSQIFGVHAIDGGDDFLIDIEINSSGTDAEDGRIYSPTLRYWDLTEGEEQSSALTHIDFDMYVSWAFADTLINAESARKDVTVNAYEAYDAGTPLDLADTLLRYSPTVRGTHLLDNSLEDFTLDWGGGDGCEIETGSGDRYCLKRTYTGGVVDGGYTLQKFDGTTWVDTTDTSWYSPQGGSYTISQIFRYDLGTGEQVYPEPIQVNLTVTPITVTGVMAENLRKTYEQKDAPDSYDLLKLPGTAQLITDIVPGSVSLTIPIAGWESSQAPGHVAVASDLSNLQGTDGTNVVDWNAVGLYGFQAMPSYDPAAIHVFYPWLTVPTTYTLEGERRIVADDTLSEYEIYYGMTTEDTNPRGGLLELRVAKKGSDGSYLDMPAGDTFRLRLPNGTIVDSSLFTGAQGRYSCNRQTAADPLTGSVGYTIRLKAGSPTDPTAAAHHELVRRSVNLGGYFQVAVTETSTGALESDFVKRYVAPRDNNYLRAYTGTTFDFTGAKAGLYPFYRDSNLGDYVILPTGYTVETTYDGITGAESGKLNRFKIQGDNWTYVTPTGGSKVLGLWTPDVAGTAMTVDYGHGASGGYDRFANAYSYTGYGPVKNPYSFPVEMIVEVQPEAQPPIPEPSLRLTYEEYGDAVTTTADGEVGRIIFDTKQVGYTTRQTVTLTLTNTGTTDVTGIFIDAAGSGGHDNEFIITQQPATNLPAGASTTFKVSYVLNLDAHGGTYPATHTAVGDDPILIYTDASNTTPAKTFETAITITDQEVYKLHVVIDPADGSMGTAKAVVGPTGVPATLDDTPVPYTFPAGEDFYLLATPLANCSVAEIYYMDGTNKVPLTQDVTTPLAGADDVLATWTMPSHDMVVYVVFEESIYSRLRLLDLQDWSGPDIGTISHQLPLMLHKTVGTGNYTPVRTAELYNTVTGTNIPPAESVLIDPDSAIQLTEDEYLVVIPADAEVSQVRLTLQGDPASSDMLKPRIDISIDFGGGMSLYTQDPSTTTLTDYTKHVTRGFDSPAPGQQRKVTITLTHDGVSRTYTLIIARRFDPDVPLTYPMEPGNSPYGMIEWDDGIADKRLAKEEYRQEDRFAVGYVPEKGSELTLTYWPQAWTGRNYDRMDEALFVFAGEDFDDYGPQEGKVTNSAGDVVEKKDISRRLTGLMIPGSGTNQQDRFESAAVMTDVLEMGSADTVRVEASAWDGRTVRPGIYALEYYYTDFDGETLVFTRPLIVLSRLGDLDQSHTRDDADSELIEGRITAPLGYEARVALYPEGALFRSRVCDVNNDRNINQIDANGVRAGAEKEYYMPVGYGK